MRRSWLERQQNCPTCRNSVFAEAQPGQAGGNQAGDRIRAVMREMHARQHRDDEAAQQQDGAAPQEVSRDRTRVLNVPVFFRGEPPVFFELRSLHQDLVPHLNHQDQAPSPAQRLRIPAMNALHCIVRHNSVVSSHTSTKFSSMQL